MHLHSIRYLIKYKQGTSRKQAGSRQGASKKGEGGSRVQAGREQGAGSEQAGSKQGASRELSGSRDLGTMSWDMHVSAWTIFLRISGL